MTQVTKIFLSWWKSIDKYTLIASLCLLIVGSILTMTASPAVASKIGLVPSHFITRHFGYAILSFFLIVTISTCEEKTLKKLAILGFFVFVILLCLVPFFGHETKGSKRWIKAFGFFLQPSELLKPCFILLTAMLLGKTHESRKVVYRGLACMILLLIVALLLFQPDVGTSILFFLTFCLQLFVSGMPMILLWIALCSSFAASFGCYVYFPHISERINRFIKSDLSYQTGKSLDSFKNSGLFGMGPGEGRIKEVLPDSHTDFIFAVAAEEFGFVACIGIMMLFLLIGVLNMYKATLAQNKFRMLSLTGLILMLCSQASINVAVSMNLMPTKGMTLPLLSYGGSSMIATSICMGIVLAITKKPTHTSKYQLARFNV